MTQFIAITRTDGGISVMQFLGDAGSDAAIIAEITKAGISAASWRRINKADLPTDRTDRDAWQDNGATIAVNATRKAALADTAKNTKVDALQSGALVALATGLFQAIKGTMAIPQSALTVAQFRAYLKSLLP